jgi:hypothetical protein
MNSRVRMMNYSMPLPQIDNSVLDKISNLGNRQTAQAPVNKDHLIMEAIKIV